MEHPPAAKAPEAEDPVKAEKKAAKAAAKAEKIAKAKAKQEKQAKASAGAEQKGDGTKAEKEAPVRPQILLPSLPYA